MYERPHIFLYKGIAADFRGHKQYDIRVKFM